jgi:hypothetical protein
MTMIARAWKLASVKSLICHGDLGCDRERGASSFLFERPCFSKFQWLVD